MQINGTADELLGILGDLKASDTKAEGRKKVGCGISVLGLLCGVPAMIFIDSMSDDVLMVLGIAAAVLIIGGLIFYSYFHSYDLDDDIQESAQQLLRFVSEDVNPKSKMDLVLDFSDAKSKQNFLRKDPPKKKSGGYSTKTITTSHYKQNVINLKARLQDGTRISVGYSKRVKHQDIKKSKPGKTKWFSRTFTKPVIGLTAVVPKERYGEPTNLDQRLRATPVQGYQISNVKVEGQKIQATIVGEMGQHSGTTADPCLRGLVWIFYELRRNKAGMIAS